MSPPSEYQALVEEAFLDRSLLASADHARAVEGTLAALDRGELRVATPPTVEGGSWVTHTWIKQAILLFFALRRIETFASGAIEYHDKIPVKRGLAEAGIRVVPPGLARYGSHLERGAVLMAGYVNIGARVGAETMVDIFAAVGSCAQVGRDCHVAAGAIIGGVLEPPGAQPVIIEDGVFVGSRGIVVEGVHIGREAVLGAGVVITGSSVIIDVTGQAPVEYRGTEPPRSVVIPGIRQRAFRAGEYGLPCALIIGQRTESTDKKVSLNAALRDFAVEV
jgi:2,3,4,5-tetrahydropyridine-2-carboxylate N-succinyltransferase